MKINRFTVSFEKGDTHFLKKYGFFKAASMARKHGKKHNVPFINDTHQLAQLLGVGRKKLFYISKNTDKYYKKIVIKKRNGTDRVLYAPKSELKQIQKKILIKILNKSDVSQYATAYIRGKNLCDNAAPHTNHKYLLKMDITDFFGSIKFLQVLSAAFNSKIYPKQIGVMLTKLCCKDNALPQGTPTSPMLSNIVMKNFDNSIGNWCAERGIAYTRYCDDLTFSSDKPLFNVYTKAREMLHRMGLEVNQDKTHFITNVSRQTVTGITVNEKVSVPKDYKRLLRQELYYSVKFGLDQCIMHGNKNDFIIDNTPQTQRYYNHLKGKISYVLQIEPENKWFAEMGKKLDVVILQSKARFA